MTPDAFSAASAIGDRTMRRLRPLFDEVFPSGVIDTTADLDQQYAGIGDLVVKSHSGTAVGFELKGRDQEWDDVTLETESNCGVRRGWLYTSRADWLVYHWLRSGRTLLAPLPAVRAWAGQPSAGGAASRIEDFPRRTQNRFAQHNLTVFYPVPIGVLVAECGCVFCPLLVDFEAELCHLAAAL